MKTNPAALFRQLCEIVGVDSEDDLPAAVESLQRRLNGFEKIVREYKNSPTPMQIAVECKRIQLGWDETDERNRRGIQETAPQDPWTAPEERRGVCSFPTI